MRVRGSGKGRDLYRGYGPGPAQGAQGYGCDGRQVPSTGHIPAAFTGNTSIRSGPVIRAESTAQFISLGEAPAGLSAVGGLAVIAFGPVRTDPTDGKTVIGTIPPYLHH